MRNALESLALTVVLVAVLAACATLGRVNPVDVAANALRAEAAAHAAAQDACAAYETALVARLVKGDPAVTGRCAALDAP